MDRTQANRFALSMPPKLKAAIRKIARAERRSMNDTIVIAIEQMIARRKAGA